MSSRRNDSQDDLALRDNGIDYDRAEDTVVLAQIDDKVGTLLVTTLHIYGRYGRLGYTNLETILLETGLDSAGDLPQLLLILGVVADKLQTLQRTDNHRHRERLCVELRTHIITEQVDQPAGTADECTDTGH